MLLIHLQFLIKQKCFSFLRIWSSVHSSFVQDYEKFWLNHLPPSSYITGWSVCIFLLSNLDDYVYSFWSPCEVSTCSSVHIKQNEAKCQRFSTVNMWWGSCNPFTVDYLFFSRKIFNFCQILQPLFKPLQLSSKSKQYVEFFKGVFEAWLVICKLLY